MSPYRRHTPADAVMALDQLGEALAEYRRRSSEIARELAEAVHAALHAGATWGEVGARLGMSKQAARQHWGSYIRGMVAERDHRTRAAGAALAAGQRPEPGKPPGGQPGPEQPPPGPPPGPEQPPPGQPPGPGQPPAPGGQPAEPPEP